MNSIFIRTAISTHRKAYAIKRMNAAAQRLLRAESMAEEIRAGRWVLAWALAAGARRASRPLRAGLMSRASTGLH
ncbi:hypothetical protein [Duganella callida]|uniref:Uncharacterized protein n=1 Tax=Duganella callida TaxID=2561932 RepID=A0A4Y9SA56_9BURK|nr:hypothetical protein [Duganella callida]TFW16456.1 hypothetical protein E4L98_23365 [Duganella callida]